MKYYYMFGLTKQRLKELGATNIIPVSFSFQYSLHPGHSDLHGKYTTVKAARNSDDELIEWVFSAEPEMLMIFKFISEHNPVEIGGRHFKSLQRNEPAGINVASKLHPDLVSLRYHDLRQ